MKRPTGFDAPPPRPPAPRQPARRPDRSEQPAPTRPRTEQPAPQQTPTPQPHGRPPGTQSQPPSVGPARIDRRAVRQARRARRRMEAAEVKRFTRRSRQRRIVIASAAGVLALFVATPIVLALSPLFAVRTIVVNGADATLTAQIRQSLSGQIGTPLALIDQGAVRTSLSTLPYVQSYTTATLPPGTLEVRVVPRVAIAQIRIASGFALVDAADVQLSTSPTRIAGMPLVTVAAGTSTASAAFAAAAAVIRAMPTTVLAKVTDVRAATRDDVTLTLQGGRKVIWGSADDSAEKAVSLRAALVEAARGATVIDVSSPGVVSIR